MWVNASVDWCQTNASMDCPHVGINALTPRESFHTYPASMSVALSACHMVASFIAFDGNFASRAIFHIMRSSPLLELIISAVAVPAFDAVVIFYVAVWADAQKT